MSEERAVLIAELDRARAAILAGDPEWRIGDGIQKFADRIAGQLIEREGLGGEVAERVERAVALALAASYALGFAAALCPDLRVTKL